MTRYEWEIRENRTPREREQDARLACHDRVAEELLRVRRQNALVRAADWLASLFIHAPRASATAIPRRRIVQ